MDKRGGAHQNDILTRIRTQYELMRTISLIAMRLFLLPFTLVWVLIPPLSFAQDKAKSPIAPPLILGDPGATDAAELRQTAESLQRKSCEGRYLNRPTSVADFIGGRIKDIRVVRFDRAIGFSATEELRNSVRKVWLGEFQYAACQINWAEFSLWSIEAIVEFEDGKRSELLTDGSHVALQDHDGKSWFFRLLPAAQ